MRPRFATAGRVPPYLPFALVLSLAALCGALLLSWHFARAQAARRCSIQTAGSGGGAQADASAPESHRQLVVRQLYEQPERFSDVSYLEMLEDEGLAPLTKAAQRWIYEAQHPDPATCAQQQFVLVGWDLDSARNGLGSCIHAGGNQLTPALDGGLLFVWHKEAGSQFVDPGCGRGAPHSNILCLFEPPSSCGLEHVTPQNSRRIPHGDRMPPPRHLAELLGAHYAERGIQLTPDFLKYWWRGQTAAYLARPNALLRGELARLRRRRDMFVRLTPQQAVDPPGYPLPPGAIHVHVRHGKKAEEMKLLNLTQYLEAGDKHLVNANPIAYKKFAVMSTDDSDVLKEAARIQRLTQETSPDGNWVMFASNENRTDKGGMEWTDQIKEFGATAQITSHLLNLFVALECDAWVGTRGSNWDRMIDELRCAWVDKCTRPYVEAGPVTNFWEYGWRRR